MDHRLQAGHVIASLDRIGQRQQAMEHGGHHMGGGHPLALDPAQGVFGIPAIHQHQAVPQMQRGGTKTARSGVIERPGHQMDARAGLELEQGAQHAGQTGHHIGIARHQGAPHPLGSACGTRGIEHQGPCLAILGGGGGMLRQKRLVITKPGDFSNRKTA